MTNLVPFILDQLSDLMYRDISNLFSAYLVKLSPTHMMTRTHFHLFSVLPAFLDSL